MKKARISVAENWWLGTNQSVVCRALALFTKSAKVWNMDSIGLWACDFGVLIEKKSYEVFLPTTYAGP